MSLNKLIHSETSITMQQKSANLKSKLLSAKDSIGEYTKEIQKMAMDMGANGGGTLGPDQVKEILIGVTNNLNAIQSKISEVAEGVPASDGNDNMGETMDNESTEDENSELTAMGENSNSTKKEFGLQSKGEKKGSKTATSEGDKLREQVASLLAKDEMREREKLASEFSNLFPLSVRKAKFDEIIASKEPLQILQAKLEGAKATLVSTKIASKKISSANTTIFHEEGGVGQRSASMGNTADLTDI